MKQSTLDEGKIERIAETLAASRYRFLTGAQIGAIRRYHGASRDEVRTAAVVADRIRRHRQLAEGRNSFAIADLVEIDTPITLSVEPRRRVPRR